MFKKSKRSQIRQRARNHSDSEDEDSRSKNDDNKQTDSLAGNAKQEIPTLSFTEINLSINESSQSNESSNDIRSVDLSTTKKATKLSFHHDEDEEEEDVFKVKKSIYSKRMERNKMKILKSSNSTTGTVKSKQQFVDEISDIAAKQEPPLQKKKVDVDEPMIVENHQNEDNIDIVICPSSEDDENEEARFVPRRPQPAADQVHEFRNVIERGTIPDAKVIYELKKQRQKLARTINEDFIALNSDEEETLRQESRLHRDDDGDEADDKSDGDDEDDEERIQFGKVDYKTKEREKAMEVFRMAQQDKEALEQQKRKEASSEDSTEYSDDDRTGQGGEKQSDDSEDELDRWEREQIRKAVCLPSLHSYNEIEFQNRFLQNEKKSTAANSRPHGNDNHSVIPIEIDDDDAALKQFGSHIPAYISSSSRAGAENDYESVNNRRSDFRRRLESSLEDNKQLLDRVEMDARLTKQSIDEFQCREDAFVEDAQFYHETLDFVRNLCECINDKLGQIEKCESEATELFKSRSTGQIDRFQKAVKDQHDACIQLITNLRVNAVDYAAVTYGTSIFEFYDFGGNEEKRSRLWKREERMRKYSLQQIVDGVSDDEAEDEEFARELHDKIAAIQSQLDDVFEDTEEEYATVKGVVKRFELWKQTRLDSYADSFVGQFIVKFIVYYIRHELALWNLFDLSQKYEDPIKQMDCIRNLIIYGASHEPLDPKAEVKSRKVDIDIVPAAIDKAIFAKLTTLIQNGAWNPMSSRQTTRLVLFLTSILFTCPSLIDSSEALPELFKAIVLRFDQAIEKDIYIPQVIPPDFFAKGSLTTRSHYETLVISYITTFFHRQFWQAVKLLRNVISLRHLIADNVIKELVLDKLLNRLLIMSISRCAADGDAVLAQVTRIVDLLPIDWTHKTNPVLSKFFDLIQQMADAADRTDEQRKKLMALRVKLAQ